MNPNAAGAAGAPPNLGGQNPADLMNNPMVKEMMNNPEMMKMAMDMAQGQGGGGNATTTPEGMQKMMNNPGMSQILENPEMMESALNMMKSNPAMKEMIAK